MSRKLFIAAALSLVTALLAAQAFAQAPKTPPKHVAADMPPFANLTASQAMARAEEKLQKVEAATNRVKLQGMLTAEDTDALRDNLTDYGQSLMAASEKAHDDAQAAASSQGAKGSTRTIVDLEGMAKEHARRLTAVKATGEEIKQRMKEGKIKVSKSFLDRINGPDRQKFKDFLTSDGRKEIEKVSPGYFDGTSGVSLMSPREFMIAVKGAQRSLVSCATHLDFSLVPEARADAWAPCVAPCYAGDVIDCSLCGITAAWDTYQAWQDYQSCMSTVSWWNWWWSAVCAVELALRVA